jgi:hypothetical protein
MAIYLKYTITPGSVLGHPGAGGSKLKSAIFPSLR